MSGHDLGAGPLFLFSGEYRLDRTRGPIVSIDEQVGLATRIRPWW